MDAHAASARTRCTTLPYRADGTGRRREASLPASAPTPESSSETMVSGGGGCPARVTPGPVQSGEPATGEIQQGYSGLGSTAPPVPPTSASAPPGSAPYGYQPVIPGAVHPGRRVVVQPGSGSGKAAASLVFGILGCLNCSYLLGFLLWLWATISQVDQAVSVVFRGNGNYGGSDFSGLNSSLIGVLLMPAITVILGHVAIRDINGSSGRVVGKGLAVAGLVLGYISAALGFLSIILLVYLSRG